MKRPLKDAVAEHVADRQLSAVQMAALLSRQAELVAGRQPQAAPPRRVSPRRLRALALAASLVVAVMVGFLAGRAPTAAEYLDRAIEESVHNHVLQMPLEVRGDSVAGLREFFHRLDFEPRSAGAPGAPLALLGGRYCSIQGHAAAQLRYAAPGAQPVTVFQVPMDERLRARLPVERSVDGVRVLVLPRGELMVVQVSGMPG